MVPGAGYPCVLFDWDGCLAQTLEVWMRGYKTAFAQFGLFPNDRAIAEQFGDWTGFRALGVQESDTDQFIRSLFDMVNVELPAVHLYPGARKLLEKLRARGVRMAVITSSMLSNLQQAMVNNGVERHFDAIITGEDVTRHKPHPESVEAALARIGARAGDAVMIGDSAKDLAAASSAGVDSILMYPPAHDLYYDLDELRRLKPTYECTSFDEVAGILFPG